MPEGAVGYEHGSVGVFVLSRYRLFLWLLVVAVSAVAEDDAELAHINAALQVWLQAIEADAPYLLMDRGAAELRLMHGGAVLRRMTVVADSLGVQPPMRLEVIKYLRRFRPSDPWRSIALSPFDWEQNLVDDASAQSALYCTAGVLIYASPVWWRSGVVALQLKTEDLRAMYNVAKTGLALVVLPRGWRAAR